MRGKIVWESIKRSEGTHFFMMLFDAWCSLLCEYLLQVIFCDVEIFVKQQELQNRICLYASNKDVNIISPWQRNSSENFHCRMMISKKFFYKKVKVHNSECCDYVEFELARVMFPISYVNKIRDFPLIRINLNCAYSELWICSHTWTKMM